MKYLKARLLLFLGGLVLVSIGATVLFAPHPFFASNQVILGSDPSLLSEVRAPGALLLSTGLFIVLAAFRPTLITPALALSTVVFGSYGGGRIISLLWDGIPTGGLLGAAVVEIALAIASAAVWASRHASGEATMAPLSPNLYEN